MGSHGIRDQVCIVGMGCTQFKEQWNKGVDEMLVDSVTDAIADANVKLNDVDAWWLGTMASGNSGITLSRAAEARLQAGVASGELLRDGVARRSATRATRWRPVRTTSSVRWAWRS